MKARRRQAPKTSEQERTVASGDGVVMFRLVRGASGIFVERVQRRGAGTLSHSAMFFTAADFNSFCDSDDLRFEYQLTYLQLRKAFEELIDGSPAKPSNLPNA